MHFLTHNCLPRLLLAGVLVCLAAESSAQTFTRDGELRTGKLDNGLTYYIRHNANPKGTADFYTVYDVGALQEEESQNGLAHFLEHMAFNGLLHYPEKTMLEFLAKEGVRFGYNVNAYTSQTETVYHVDKVPLVRESFVDSVLMILHDWSGGITCDQQAIDEERGVIREEWRRGSDNRRKVFQLQREMVYGPDALQSNRTVLGKLEVIENFKQEELLDFYHKWYRPDLEAIIVVGDFDAEAMERKVRRLFSDIPAAVNRPAKATYSFPRLPEPVFRNMVDSTANFLSFKVFYRSPFPSREVRGTGAFYKDAFIRTILSNVMCDRMNEAVKSAECPAKSGIMVTYPEGENFYVDLFTIIAKNGRKQEDLVDFYGEQVRRMITYGISATELERGKSKTAIKYHLNGELMPEAVQNSDLAGVYLAHFLDGYPAADPVAARKARQAILKEITLDDVRPYVRKVFQESDKFYSWYVDDDKLQEIPTAERMKEILAKWENASVEPGFKVYREPDLHVDAVPGKIVKVQQSAETGGEIWLLGNGAKVYWTPSAKPDGKYDLSLKIYFDTGYKALPKDKLQAARFAAGFIQSKAGFGGADAEEIGTSRSRKGIGIMQRISRENATLFISAEENRADTAFRMAHLMIADPCLSTEKEFDRLRKGSIESLKQQKSHAASFNEAYDSVYYGPNLWVRKIDSTEMRQADMDLVREVYSREYGRLAGMTVFICSDLPKAEIQDYVTRYLASLHIPYSYNFGKETPALPAFRGAVRLEREYPKVNAPRCIAGKTFKTRIKPTAVNRGALDIIDHILSARFLGQIREKRGGTYSIRFTSENRRKYGGLTESGVQFETKPELVETLLGDVADVMEDLCVNGPTEDEMQQAKAYLIKHAKEVKMRNESSVAFQNLETIAFVQEGKDPRTDYEALFASITPKTVRKIARKICAGDTLTSLFIEK